MKCATGTVGVVRAILKDASPVDHPGPPPPVIVLPQGATEAGRGVLILPEFWSEVFGLVPNVF
jgi:hypothetical protein